MTAEQVRRAGFRLADAQSAVARKTGFAGWPQLARHVEQLRALEGTWAFAHLEVDGLAVPPRTAANSRILIDGDRFRTESPEATYEGVFTVDVEAQPHAIDIEFVAGPEAGNWNFGIFRVAGDQFELCLDMNGRPRPTEFRTDPGSGHAYERLTRTSPARPAEVTGGTPPPQAARPPASGTAAFPYVECPTLTRLRGEWAAVQVVRDGQELPAMMVNTGVRSLTRNELKVFFGGRVMIDALVRVDEHTDPVHIDYLTRCGPAEGQVQLGIMKWVGEEVCTVMAAPGQPRPADFSCPAGSGYTLSRWRQK
jgi:uncharacterized protein (TIGR03067 family)